MRVCMIAQSSYDYDARILKQTSALIKSKYEVDIICLGTENSLKYERINGVNVYRIMKFFPQDKIFSYVFFSIIFLIKAFFKSSLLSLKNKPDVIQVHNMPDYLVFATLFHKIIGVPVVLDIHDLTVELFKEKWGESKFKLLRPILIWTEKLSVKFADRVITVSEQCGNRLKERGLSQEKLTIVMNVPDSSTFSYFRNRPFKEITNSLRLVYTGTVAERYGVHKTILALPAVVAQIPDTVFDIYGNSDNEYDKYLSRLTEQLKLNDNVKFNGIIPYELVGERLMSADIALVMSANTEYTNFGIPTKIFEYANVGLPVIVTNLKAVKDIFGENSMSFVDPDNPEQIANEIINLCKDPARRKTMTENAYLKTSKVSGNIMMGRYLDLINSLKK